MGPPSSVGGGDKRVGRGRFGSTVGEHHVFISMFLIVLEALYLFVFVFVVFKAHEGVLVPQWRQC